MIESAAAPRAARGVFLAAACLLLALAGHVLGGGRMCCLPALPVLLGAGGAVSALCVALAGQMLSFRRILAVVGWAQVAFHFAFGLGGASAGHHLGAVPVPPSAPGVAVGPSMIAGHAAAAVAAAALLAGAERAVWWLYGAVFAVAFARLAARPVTAHRPPWPVVVADDPAPRRGVLLARAVRRRGPPVALRHTG